MNEPMDFEQFVALCKDTHQQLVVAAGRSVDTHLVARNFLFGLYIVHFEQEGSDRARYGKQALKAMSTSLKTVVGRGISVDNLELLRKFFTCFRSDILAADKSETPSRKSVPGHMPQFETLSSTPHSPSPPSWKNPSRRTCRDWDMTSRKPTN